MVNCYNIECLQYGDQPDCHKDCPLMARALALGAAATIFNDRIWRTTGGPLALFPGDSNKPIVVRGGGNRVTLNQIVPFAPQIQYLFPPSLFGKEVLVLNDSKLYIAVDPFCVNIDTFLQLAVTPDGHENLTAGPYDLWNWYENMSTGIGCSSCIRYEPDSTGLRHAWQLPFTENVVLAERAVKARLLRQKNLPQQPISIRDKQQSELRLKLASDGHDDHPPVQMTRSIKGK